MATRKSAAEQERMTDENIQKVIRMLNPPEGADYKAWTKKEACQFLGMAYNTTRLGSIIEKFQEKQLRDQQRRAALRGKPATQDEIVFAIGEYLAGETVESISKALFRSASFVKRILEENSVPIRGTGNTYFKPELIPEGAVRDEFKLSEVVYSARYDSPARIDAEATHPEYGNIYRVWLLADKWKQSAWQPACELASLEHLRKLGVKI
jgi:hypothetical protein